MIPPPHLLGVEGRGSAVTVVEEEPVAVVPTCGRANRDDVERQIHRGLLQMRGYGTVEHQRRQPEVGLLLPVLDHARLLLPPIDEFVIEQVRRQRLPRVSRCPSLVVERLEPADEARLDPVGVRLPVRAQSVPNDVAPPPTSRTVPIAIACRVHRRRRQAPDRDGLEERHLPLPESHLLPVVYPLVTPVLVLRDDVHPRPVLAHKQIVQPRQVRVAHRVREVVDGEEGRYASAYRRRRREGGGVIDARERDASEIAAARPPRRERRIGPAAGGAAVVPGVGGVRWLRVGREDGRPPAVVVAATSRWCAAAAAAALGDVVGREEGGAIVCD